MTRNELKKHVKQTILDKGHILFGELAEGEEFLQLADDCAADIVKAI